jgi:FAD/FMN-containing dehydrogenase
MTLAEHIKTIFSGDVDDSAATLEKYSHDASLFSVRPTLVVFPKDSTDIQKLVRFVNEHREEYPGISVTARAAGTCMAGGSLTHSIVLDTTRYMNKIISISPVTPYEITPIFAPSRTITISGEAVVEPGVFYRDFEAEAAKQNLLLPSFTASKSINALGGMVGNNSGGELTLQYGKTEEYVAEVSMVCADGNEYTIVPLSQRELAEKVAAGGFEGKLYANLATLLEREHSALLAARPKVTKNSAGYTLWNVFRKEKNETIFDPLKLIVGSQGTLGIVTKIKLYLVIPKPAHGMAVVFLHSLGDLGAIVNDALVGNPETIEAYDDKTITLAIRFWAGFIKKRGFIGALKLGLSFLPELKMLVSGMPKLVLLVTYSGETMNEVTPRLNSFIEKIKLYQNLSSRLVFDMAESEKYWTIRHDSFALLREHFKGLRTAPFIDDVAVPSEKLPEFLPKLTEILLRHKLTYNIHGHAANGNFHIIPLMNLHDQFAGETILEVSEEVYTLVLSYGGTITAEHNDGIIRTPYLTQMYGEHVVSVFAEVKKMFDPNTIFNPGKKVGGTKEDILKAIG